MNENCVLYRAVDFFGKRWTILILLELSKKKQRYNQLKNNLPGITSKILAKRLKELEIENLIKKEIDTSKIPIKTEYFLTKEGKNFLKIIDELKKWAIENKFRNKFCENNKCITCEN